MRKKRLIKLAVVILVVCLSMSHAAIVFESSVKIGTPVDHSPSYLSQVKINVVDSGKVDAAWRGVSTAGVYYTYWDSSIAGNPSSEQVKALAKSDIGGIGRDLNGDILIGHTDTSWYLQESKKSGGVWTMEQAGGGKSFSTDGDVSYSVNPFTGKGEFVAQDPTLSNGLRHVYRDVVNNNWTSAKAGTTPYGNSFPSITHADNGTAYFVAGTGYSTSNYTGGASGGMTALTTTQGKVYSQSDIDEYNGTLYAIATANWKYGIYTSINGGTTWVENIAIPMANGVATPSYSPHGLYFSVEIAVGPNGEMAGLFYDKVAGSDYYNLFLAYRDNLADTTWDLKQLTTSTTAHALQTPDLAFDSAGDLYVAYYNPADDEMYLVSTVPEPATMLILLGGCLMMRLKKA